MGVRASQTGLRRQLAFGAVIGWDTSSMRVGQNRFFRSVKNGRFFPQRPGTDLQRCEKPQSDQTPCAVNPTRL